MRMFKAKKVKKKKRKFLLIVFTFFFFFSYMLTVSYLKANRLKNTILKSDVNYLNYNIHKELLNKIDDVINKPVSLLNQNVKNARKMKTQTNKTSINNKQSKNTVNEVMQESAEPIVYVYNTHQSEDYNGYSVYDASLLLANNLNEKKTPTYFEEQSIKTFLDQNNFKYYKSYVASRKYLDDARNKYLSLKYFFDIHRDSVSKKISTVTYKEKSYAKILFVIGLDNPSNEKNNSNSSVLNELINSKVPGISRGIVKHGGKGYNGVYNQDVSENVFLIEVGGKDNTKEEVENTINVISESILEYIRGVI